MEESNVERENGFLVKNVLLRRCLTMCKYISVYAVHKRLLLILHQVWKENDFPVSLVYLIILKFEAFVVLNGIITDIRLSWAQELNQRLEIISCKNVWYGLLVKTLKWWFSSSYFYILFISSDKFYVCVVWFWKSKMGSEVLD